MIIQGGSHGVGSQGSTVNAGCDATSAYQILQYNAGQSVHASIASQPPHPTPAFVIEDHQNGDSSQAINHIEYQPQNQHSSQEGASKTGGEQLSQSQYTSIAEDSKRGSIMQKLVDLGHAPQPEPTPIVAGENSIEEDLTVAPNLNENTTLSG